MSKVAIEGNASGTGTLTIAAPNTNSSFTLSLPTNTGTIITQNSTPAFASTIGVGGATAAASGAGITFPATVSASSDANTLDDYEEGTWTPVAATAGYTMSASSGQYTRIGRAVFLRFSVRYSAISAQNSLNNITGVPFTSANLQFTGSGRDCTTTGAIYVAFLGANDTLIELNSYSGVANGSARTFATNETYVFSLNYVV
jgi:hypothetical protein